jgi:hypothetical protein
MDPVLNAIDALFDTEEGVPAPKDHGRTVLEESERVARTVEAREERKKTEEELKRNNRGIYGRYGTAHVPPMTADDCDTFIDAEMGRRMKTTRWHNLDACFKWKKITEFVQAQHPGQDMAAVRDAFRARRLDKVTYDMASQSVVRLNHMGL